jgi:hypothetical protein
MLLPVFAVSFDPHRYIRCIVSSVFWRQMKHEYHEGPRLAALTRARTAPLPPVPASESIFQNSVDPNFVGIPPIPLENAEWMGHASLR